MCVLHRLAYRMLDAEDPFLVLRPLEFIDRVFPELELRLGLQHDAQVGNSLNASLCDGPRNS